MRNDRYLKSKNELSQFIKKWYTKEKEIVNQQLDDIL